MTSIVNRCPFELFNLLLLSIWLPRSDLYAPTFYFHMGSRACFMPSTGRTGQELLLHNMKLSVLPSWDPTPSAFGTDRHDTTNLVSSPTALLESWRVHQRIPPNNFHALLTQLLSTSALLSLSYSLEGGLRQQGCVKCLFFLGGVWCKAHNNSTGHWWYFPSELPQLGRNLPCSGEQCK